MSYKKPSAIANEFAKKKFAALRALITGQQRASLVQEKSRSLRFSV